MADVCCFNKIVLYSENIARIISVVTFQGIRYKDIYLIDPSICGRFLCNFDSQAHHMRRKDLYAKTTNCYKKAQSYSLLYMIL